MAAKYPSWSPYSFSFNSPLAFNDPDGEKPRIQIIPQEDGSVKIKITNYLFVFNKGKEAKRNSLNADKINEVLKGGLSKVGDKNVTIEIETQVIQVKNRKAAEQAIEKNEGFGVVVRNSSRFWNKNNRAEHTSSEYSASGYDELNVGTGHYKSHVIQAHEVGHDLGFADKYADIKGVGSMSTEEGLTSLMGVGNILSQSEIDDIARTLVNNGGPVNDRAIDTNSDRIPLGETKLIKIEGQIKDDGTILINDKADKMEVNIESNVGTPRGTLKADEK